MACVELVVLDCLVDLCLRLAESRWELVPIAWHARSLKRSGCSVVVLTDCRLVFSVALAWLSPVACAA